MQCFLDYISSHIIPSILYSLQPHITMVHPPQPRDRRDFGIAIKCALQLEANAVKALFDQIWGDDGEMYRKAPGDPTHILQV